ncbi:MAG: hypothetical protein KAS98_03400 [Deltaproteobacteria bacterium]|nr:hypothetical protein [Deltaproteobacteria bacterium]MBW2553082.1 hypothetical protein [Deltaproteobacteria bacterium]MCK5009504.1 hypothetical protein [Deltaproteobacteria bacterium]MCK5187130.1 hypothetical protein [Deltaproteobacteria bacterium]
MKVSHLTLIVLAAFVWFSGGIALLLKGSALIKSAYAIDSQSLWAPAALLLGVIAGLLKGKFLFSKSCKKNIQRIRSLANPHVWHCFRPGMLIFLAIIIPAGAWMSRAAAGNYTYLCLVGALDLSISFALLTSSIVFLQLRAFQPLGTKAR